MGVRVFTRACARYSSVMRDGRSIRLSALQILLSTLVSMFSSFVGARLGSAPRLTSLNNPEPTLYLWHSADSIFVRIHFYRKACRKPV